VLPSISETIGGTEEERTKIIALNSLNFIAAYVQVDQRILLKSGNLHCCKYNAFGKALIEGAGRDVRERLYRPEPV